MQVGGCRVEGELERSPGHVLYRAQHLASQRPVAVRVILASAAASPEVRQRFVAEAQALTRLDHPSVQRVLEVGEASGNVYLALEPTPGAQPIGALLQQRPEPLPVFTAVQIAARLASALEHCHAQGVVHRDVAIGSVLLTADGIPILTGFGVTKDVDPSQIGVAETGRSMGTPGYSSPEQASGQVSQIGPGVDVYGLGAVLYTLLVRRTPSVGSTPMEILSATMSAAPAPPSSIRPEVPAAVEAVCLRCLAKDPGQRYGSAAELRAALDGLLSAPPAAQTQPVRLSHPGESPPMHPVGASPAEPEAIGEPIAPEPDPGEAKAPKKSPRRSRGKVGSVSRGKAPAVDEGEEEAKKGLPIVPIAAGGVGVLLLLALAAVFLLGGEDPRPPAKADPQVAASDPGDGPDDGPGEEPSQEPEAADPAQAELDAGLKLLDEEDYPGAVKALGRAIAADPDLALAYHARGSAHYGLADYEQALADFEKAVELEPDAPEAHHNRGAAAESLDDLELAVEAYERFLELSPRSDVAAAVRKDVRRLRKQLGG